MLGATSIIRRTGVAVALAAVILLLAGWLLLVRPSDGTNLGAGLVLSFGEAVAVAGTGVLLCSLGRARRHNHGAARRRWTDLDLPGKLGALLGVCFVVSWVIGWFLISIQLFFAGDATFVVAAVLMSTSRA